MPQSPGQVLHVSAPLHSPSPQTAVSGVEQALVPQVQVQLPPEGVTGGVEPSEHRLVVGAVAEPAPPAAVPQIPLPPLLVAWQELVPQVHVHVAPAFVTGGVEPSEQRLVAGALAVGTPLAVPQVGEVLHPVGVQACDVAGLAPAQLLSAAR